MWCDYKDFFCINPLCLGGCIDQKNDRETQLKTIEALAKLAAAMKEEKK